MFDKDTLRVACIIAVLYGAFMISRGGEQGFFVTLYRIILVVGGTIGLLWLGFPNKKKETEKSLPSKSLLRFLRRRTSGCRVKNGWGILKEIGGG